jgi:hypothetical protein
VGSGFSRIAVLKRPRNDVGVKMRGVVLLSAALLTAASSVYAQGTPFPRLPATALDVTPPTDRVRGEPGTMALRPRDCRTIATADTRRRIVDIAIQEWAFFGFPIVNATSFDDESAGEPAPGPGDIALASAQDFRRRSRVPPEEAVRVAPSIAGYWAVTPEGAWIVNRQNEVWSESATPGGRWRDPWSAAFISWVMCEAGLGTNGQFQRAVAHHAYVDQAIRARDNRASQAAYTAYNAGDAPIEPGDLLCSGRRPTYRTIDQRRQQMGVGARMHCDIVIQVEEPAARILAIGGNVRGRVAMKLLPAAPGASGHLRPIDRMQSERTRPVFAHLKLAAANIPARVLDTSPTVRAMGCNLGWAMPAHLVAANVSFTRPGMC